MEGKERREAIIKLLENSKTPISGGELAKRFGVSRQVIVQDIALLRAIDKNILSTTKGYVMYVRDNSKCNRTYAVCHDNSQIKDELFTIVDYGGKVLDVIVMHDIYGQITVDLILNNRMDVEGFVDKVKSNGDKPLMKLTNGLHFHTVEAENEMILDKIEEELARKGYLRK